MVYINMKRLWMVCFLIVVSSFVFAYSSATPDPGHGAENVFVYVNGQNLGLQSAIDSGKFGAYYTGGSYSGSVVSGHDDNIFVRVSGIDKSLQQAINDGSLCASGSGSGSPSGSVVFGHKGDDVLIDFGGEKSLQQAINEGLFGRDCAVPVNCVGSWNYNYGSCSATACGTVGRYDKQWVTTVSPSGGGSACPSPTFVDNGGNSCATAACAPVCTSKNSYACYSGDVYYYDSCGDREGMKKSCSSPYSSRGGCWNGYCVAKYTRHFSSLYSDHIVSGCGITGVCESIAFNNYGSAEIAFYLINDASYPSSSRVALYRLQKSFIYPDSDHMISVITSEGGYINEGFLGYALNSYKVGTSRLYRKASNAGNNDHMVTFSTTEGNPTYTYEGPYGYVITSGVQTG